MPKGKRKGKSGQGLTIGKMRADIMGTSDEDSLNDNASNISIASDTTIVEDGNGDEVDEQSQEDLFEEKLCEAIDGISQKSAQGRANSLEAVCKAFTRKFVPEFLVDRRLTICDGIERSLKKGRGLEQGNAAQLAAVLCVQLGAGDMTDQVCHDLKPLLTFLATDTSVCPITRGKCCWTLAMLGFLSSSEALADILRTLQQIFCLSYVKGDGTTPNVTPEMATLHASALSAWCLLLTVVDIQNDYSIPDITQLTGLLDSSYLDVRMAAGEAIALLLEQGRSYDEDYEWEASDQLIEKLKQLATDSHKYRAKKDRKTQRSSFRDILKYVESDVPPNIQVRFGQEALSLDSWKRKKQYDAFCQILGSGMNLHLTENELLRDIFELGSKVVPITMAANKQNKLERHLLNAANFKARSISRAKNRDKRSAFLAA